MRRLVLVAIRLYWRYWPKSARRKCIFRETCSHHIYHITRTQGAVAGIRAMMDRLRKCRPGFKVYSKDGRLRVRLADGSSIDESEAAPYVLSPYKSSAEMLQQSLNENNTSSSKYI